MSDSYREQFPLLCDDLSDEEHYSPHYQRQYRQMTYRGRAKSNVKGAVAILKRWPEHWSSFIAYWWIGVVIICLMTFILYNSLFAFAVLPTAHFKPLNTQEPNLNIVRHTSVDVSQFPNVYTHLFTDNKKEIDLNKYLPYIEAMASKYSKFNYHVVVVLNDTSTGSPELSLEENNVNALNSLWTTDIITKNAKTMASNINIEYISLTKYMDNSPLRKYWSGLSTEIIEFLVRAVSIWDKGGVTFNPIILTPQSPNAIYNEKLEHIFKTFRHSNSVNILNKKPSNASHHKIKQKVNNIRDIIDALESENSLDISHDEILAEAENKNEAFIAPSIHKRSTGKSIRRLANKSVSKRDVTNLLSSSEHDQEKTKAIQTQANNDTTTPNILPAYLDYLFHHNSIKNRSKPELHEKYSANAMNFVSNQNNLKTDAMIENKDKTVPITNKSIKVDKEWLKPMIIPAKEAGIEINEIQNNSLNIVEIQNNERHFSSDGNEDQLLTIDIKGNLLATKTACHAFLGTMFTDAIHYGYNEKFSDFIIKELSIFCNGVLSSCNGIDIIIL